MKCKTAGFLFTLLSLALVTDHAVLAKGSRTLIVTLDRDAYVSADLDFLSDQIRELIGETQNPVRLSAGAREVAVTSDDIERDATFLALVRKRFEGRPDFSLSEIPTNSIQILFTPETLKTYSAEKLSREKDSLSSFVKQLKVLPHGVTIASGPGGVVVRAENPAFGAEASREIGVLFTFEPIDKISWRVTLKPSLLDHMTPVEALHKKRIVDLTLREFLGEPRDVPVEWTSKGVAIVIPNPDQKAHRDFADIVVTAFANAPGFTISKTRGAVIHVALKDAKSDRPEVPPSVPKQAVWDVMTDLRELANPTVQIDHQGNALWIHAQNIFHEADRLVAIKQGLMARQELNVTTRADQSLLVEIKPESHIGPTAPSIDSDQLKAAVTLRATALRLLPIKTSVIDAQHIRIYFDNDGDTATFREDLSDRYGFAMRLVDEGKPSASDAPPSLGDDRKVLPTGSPVWLSPEILVNGSMIASAKAGIDHTSGMPEVEFQLTPAGRARFAQATQLNVGKRFAIILDGKVLTAPVIQGPIEGGKGEISGGFTPEEAQTIAASLLAYREELPLKIVDEKALH